MNVFEGAKLVLRVSVEGAAQLLCQTARVEDKAWPSVGAGLTSPPCKCAELRRWNTNLRQVW